MSFSTYAKDEAARVSLSDADIMRAELCAFIRMCASIEYMSKDKNINFETQRAPIARRLFTIIRGLYNVELNVNIRKRTSLKKNNVYELQIKDKVINQKLLSEMGIISFMTDNKIPPHLINNGEKKAAFLRAAFLSLGSVSSPEKNYHLELSFDNELLSNEVFSLMNFFNLNPKKTMRNDKYMIYIKGAEEISDFLTVINAVESVLKLENIRALKDVRNFVNRRINCETANINKTVDAAQKQIEDIELINKVYGLEKLDDSLRELALIRLENKEATFSEIGAMLKKPLGKSGINHRFKKISELADKIRGDVL